MNHMSVICSKCGCADVLCEAMINPNTKVFENYTDESFLYGWCNVCQTGRTLTDVEDVKAIIDNNFSKFCEKMDVSLDMLSVLSCGKTIMVVRR